MRKILFVLMIMLVVLTLPQYQPSDAAGLHQPVFVWESQRPAIEEVHAQAGSAEPLLVRILTPTAPQSPEVDAGSDQNGHNTEDPAPSTDPFFPDLPGHLSLVTAVSTSQAKPPTSSTSATTPVVPVTDRIVNTHQPMVALTFDDGPNSTLTTSILDTLKKHQAAATFFVIGRLVPGNRSVVRRIIAEGHEIGNHTYDHKDMTKISISESLRQIERTQQAVLDAVGVAPRLVRPPYGMISKTTLAQMPLPVVMWSIDPRDWDKSSVNAIVKAALYQVRDGDIVVLHDSKKLTAEATKIIVPELIKRGFQLVTVSELFAARGIEMKTGSVAYRRAG